MLQYLFMLVVFCSAKGQYSRGMCVLHQVTIAAVPHPARLPFGGKKKKERGGSAPSFH